jgi:cytochrome c553
MLWFRRIAMGIIVTVVLALAVIYAGSEWVLRKSYDAPLPQIAADNTPTGIAEGARLATIYGCRDCHGATGQGRVLFDAPPARMIPPPLAQTIAAYSDPELARLIRHSVKRDGSSTFIMPPNGHAKIADDDIARLIGWMRTLKPSSDDIADRTSYRLLGRALLIGGAVEPSARPDAVAPKTRPADPGGYFAASVCGGCHSLHAEEKAHDDGRPVPALAAIGAAYDDAAFTKLLRTGAGMTPRELGLMAAVSKSSLSHLTDAEIASVHAYLKGEAANAPPQ